MKVDTYPPSKGVKLCNFALSPIVVENHTVYVYCIIHYRVELINIYLQLLWMVRLDRIKPLNETSL